MRKLSAAMAAMDLPRNVVNLPKLAVEYPKLAIDRGDCEMLPPVVKRDLVESVGDVDTEQPDGRVV
jgi:hypothetical protein